MCLLSVGQSPRGHELSGASVFSGLMELALMKRDREIFSGKFYCRRREAATTVMTPWPMLGQRCPFLSC